MMKVTREEFLGSDAEETMDVLRARVELLDEVIQFLRDENAKLRELVAEYATVADNLCRDGFLCGPLSHCRYYEECGGKFYCKPGELKQKAKGLGIEVPDGRA